MLQTAAPEQPVGDDPVFDTIDVVEAALISLLQKGAIAKDALLAELESVERDLTGQSPNARVRFVILLNSLQAACVKQRANLAET